MCVPTTIPAAVAVDGVDVGKFFVPSLYEFMSGISPVLIDLNIKGNHLSMF